MAYPSYLNFSIKELEKRARRAFKIFTGKPGCGKTTLIKEILKLNPDALCTDYPEEVKKLQILSNDP